MKILHINTYDQGGGAHKFAFDFIDSNSNNCYMLVHEKFSNHKNIEEIKGLSIEGLIGFLDKILWKLGFKKGLRVSLSWHNKLHFTYTNISNSKHYKSADIIHFHNLHGSYFNFCAIEKIAKEKKIVWSLHDMWAFSGGETYMLGNNEFKTGVVKSPPPDEYPLYGPIKDRRQKEYFNKKKIYKKYSEKITFVCGSKWLQECLSESYVHNTKMNICKIREGCDEKIFVNNNQRTWKTPRVLYVNSGIKYKGTSLLNAVFAKCTQNSFELFVIGNAHQIDHNNIKATNIEYINGEDKIAKVFNNVDILIFPSTQDNSPLFVTMALMCGVCVVGGDNSGVKNQLEDCGGIVVNLKKPEKIADFLNKSEKELIKIRNIGNSASLKAKALFSSDLMYQKYMSLYKSILNM